MSKGKKFWLLVSAVALAVAVLYIWAGIIQLEGGGR